MQEDQVSIRTKLSILAVGLLSFSGILVENSMNVTFPTLMKEMDVSLSTVQWLTTGYLLLVTIVMGTTSFVLKKFAPKTLFLFAIIISFVGGSVAMIAPDFWILLLGRLLQAVATGIATPLMFQIIFGSVPMHKIGLYTGFASVIVSLAPALEPSYGGIMASLWSWRSIFVGVLPLLVIIGVLGASVIDGKARGTAGKKFDFVGLTLLSAIFIVLLFAFQAAGQKGWGAPLFWILLVVTVPLVAVLITYLRKSTRSLIDFSILKDNVLKQRLFNYFGLQLINIGLSFILPLFVQNVLGATVMQAGLMLLPGALVGAVTAPIAGKVYDEVGPRIPLTFSAIMVIISLALFSVFTNSLSITTVAILYVILRIGFNSGFGPAVSDGSLQVHGSNKADQNSLFSMMQQYAGSIGTSISSAIIASVVLGNPGAAGTRQGSQYAFMFLLVLGVAILVSNLLTKTKTQEEK